MPQKKPVIIVVGPTASGKSELAVKIAKQINGEVISADSRQIYHGLNLGTGKIPVTKTNINDGRHLFKFKGINHYGIDIASPKKQYSVAQFQKYAAKIIANIHSRGKIPILCGGTAHWIDAVVFNQSFPEVKPNKKIREGLEKKTTAQLFAQLKKLDAERAKNIDSKNPRRLIRALEIILVTGKAIPKLQQTAQYDALWLGIKADQTELNKKIELRLKKRVKAGMLREIETLRESGLSWKRLESFGLEYKFGALYLQKKINKQEFIEQLSHAIKQYSKRQMTWWKRNKQIYWITL